MNCHWITGSCVSIFVHFICFVVSEDVNGSVLSGEDTTELMVDQNRVVMSHGKASNTHIETPHLHIEVKKQ